MSGETTEAREMTLREVMDSARLPEGHRALRELKRLERMAAIIDDADAGDVIVAEISRNWNPGFDMERAQALIGQDFQNVIRVNGERGYRLSSWKLSASTPGVAVGSLSASQVNETIVAVFEKVHPAPKLTPEEVFREFGKGCTNTDPELGGTGNPADCPECTAAAVEALKGSIDREGWRPHR